MYPGIANRNIWRHRTFDHLQWVFPSSLTVKLDARHDQADHTDVPHGDCYKPNQL